MNETTSSSKRSLFGRLNPWPVCIISYFVVAFAGCATFVVFCNRHPADLVAADYYERELRYQGQIESMRHANARPDLAKVAYDPQHRQIRIALSPQQAHGNPTGSIELYRPSAMDQDRKLPLETDANGVQTIDVKDLRPGLWKVRVSWTVDRQDYYLDQKVVVGA